MKSWIVVLLLLAGGAYWGYQKWKPAPETAAAPAKSRPTTATVTQRDIRFSVTAAGDIGPADQVSVRPEVSGRIATLPVDIGDAVKQGEVLFTLDDRDLQIERATRLTEIEGAKLQLERAGRNFERSKQLFEENLISQELFEDTKTNFELAKNAVERTQQQLSLIEDRLSKTRIVAPFDCTVLTRPVSVGQAVSGSSGINSGTEVLTIANLNDMVINSHINQADVTRLKVGQIVEVQVEAVPGLKFNGTVDRIAPQATIRNNIKGFSTRILLKNTDPRVRPGMTANLSIPVASADNVLAVPLAAVFTEKGERYVYVKSANGFERRPVQVGISDFEFAEIQSGLSAGDVVSLVQPEDVSGAGKEKSKQAAAR